MKRKELTHILTTISSNNVNLSQIIKLEDYSSSHRLFRVTALVLKFVDCIHDRLQVEDSHRSSASRDLDKATLLWVKESQFQLEKDKLSCVETPTRPLSRRVWYLEMQWQNVQFQPHSHSTNSDTARQEAPAGYTDSDGRS